MRDGSPDVTQRLTADLTEPQKQAVLHTEGPLLVLAAAGSGKTRVITRRIAHLVHSGIPPWQVLALTFTNKAAGEMRQRVEHLLNPSGEEGSRLMRGLTVTTFHSLCARLLRRYAEVAGLPGLKPDYSIYDTDDQSSLLKRVIADLGMNTTNWPPRSVLSAISNAKNDLLDAEAFAARAGDFYSKSVAKLYSGYQKGLRAANAVDFDDLLLLTATMIRDRAGIRAELRERWQYLLIDEYQDTNSAQFAIAAGIAGAGDDGRTPNICVVGDPDQAIYGWRGADITNILDFEEHFPDARVIALGENFRSTAPILAAADHLIRHNKRRKHKPLFTSRTGGEPAEVVRVRDEHAEARLIVDWMRQKHEGEESGSGPNIAWKDMAVFYRTNALSRVMEDQLRAAGVPYVIARGTAFYQREEVRSAIAYLRVVANRADDVSLLRIVNTPTRGIGKTSLARVQHWASEHGVPMLEGMRRAGEIDDLPAAARNAMARFVAMLNAWTGHGSFMGAEMPASLHDLVARVVKDSGLEAMYAKQAATTKSEADAQRVDNLAEVVSSAADFEAEYVPEDDPAIADGGRAQPPPLLAMLRAYLESVALVADADAVDPDQGAVTLMTLHAAKGLEFPAVAIMGLEQGMLPHSRSAESEAMLEEERRLCFVGMTRAMEHLLITSAQYRAIRGVLERTIPSQFLDELPAEHVTSSDQTDSWDDAPEERYSRPSFDPSRMRGMGDSPTRATSSASAPFAVGTLVRHPQFGVGKVTWIAAGANARARIDFKGVGVKTLVLEYARLEQVR